jgi:hypothetical protein
MRYATCGLALALSLALNAGADEEKGIAAARKDVLALAKEVAAGKDISKKVAALRKKYDDLEPLMWIYRPRGKGGIGFGPKSRTDGLEAKIRALCKRTLNPKALKKESAELLWMGYLNLTMAEIARAYAPQGRLAARKKEWDEHVDAMKKASAEFIKAVKTGNPRKVRAAADRLDNSCNNCHTEYIE